MNARSRGLALRLGLGLLAGSVPALCVSAGEAVPRLAWQLEPALAPAGLEPGDGFGRSVALSGGTLLVGSPFDDHGAGVDAGRVYVYVRQGTTWSEEAQLVASDADAGDQFGISVALDGDVALVGAWHDDDGGVEAGAAYAFARSGTSWSEEAKLTAPSPAANDRFGLDLDVDGPRAIVGAHLADGLAENQGAAFVFARSGTSWSLEAQLGLPSPAGEDQFGESVALDGDRALVGAVGTDGLVADTGQAFVFERSGTVWSLVATLTSSAELIQAGVGTSVDLDGDVALVGAPGIDEAYVFENDGSGWSQTARIVGEPSTGFGSSTVLHGLRGAVGQPLFDAGRGSVRLIDGRSGVWGSERSFLAAGAGPQDEFGISLAFDGDLLVVGAVRDELATSPSNSGTVTPVSISVDPTASYNRDRIEVGFSDAVSMDSQHDLAVFGLPDDLGDLGRALVVSSTPPYDAVELLAPDGEVGERFGHAVSIDGSRVAVGAWRDNVQTVEEAGSAYVFVRDGAGWSFEKKLRPSDPTVDKHFGLAVELVGDTLLVGAPNDDAAGQDAGAIYVFSRGPTGWVEANKLTASNATSFDFFGTYLAGDGTRAIAGDDTQVYVLEDQGSGWAEVQRIAYTGGGFGLGADIDGSTLVIGTPGDDGARVYRESGGVWSLEATLSVPGSIDDDLGARVAVHADTVVLSAPRAGDGDLVLVGELHVFQRVGSSWTRHPLRRLHRDADDLDRLQFLSLDGPLALALPVQSTGFAYLFDVCPAEFPSFCDGADGSLASCPCANPGAPSRGCDVAQGTGGVKLDVIGQATFPTNRLSLEATGFPAMSTPATVLIRSSTLDPASPVVFGDGLRCIGVPTVRVASSIAQGGTALLFPPHSAAAGSGTFYYQAWFRNTPAAFCTLDAFNLSNGRAATW